MLIGLGLVGFVTPAWAAAPQWESLFDGSNLDQWTMGPDRSWVIEDGLITLKREFDGKEYYLIAPGEWMRRSDLSVGVAYTQFMGLEFETTRPGCVEGRFLCPKRLQSYVPPRPFGTRTMRNSALCGKRAECLILRNASSPILSTG